MAAKFALRPFTVATIASVGHHLLLVATLGSSSGRRKESPRAAVGLSRWNRSHRSGIPADLDAATVAKRMTAEKPNVVFVLGAPGSGKGTQCQKIVDKFGYVHLSAGDLLREERKTAGSEYGELIQQHMTDGSIVPVAITCSLLQRAMKASGKTNFLIDGFPRNKDNADGWNEAMGQKANVKAVLFFDCEEKTCVDRCLSRGAGRSDDNVESLKKRFVTYINDTMPIVNNFKEQGLVKEIDANRPKEDVFADVTKIFEEK